jgi:DNA-binding NtrC family response regulator
LRVLAAHHWPGNIRQLENAVFRAVVLAETDALGLDEFPQIAAQIGMRPARLDEGAPAAAEAPSMAPTDDLPALAPMPYGEATQASSAVLLPPLPGDALAVLDAAGEVRPLDEIEAELIRYAITHYRGQMSEVARRLQIGRSTLYRKLEALGLNSERGEGDNEAVAAERQPPKFA